jgi:hypothetical protein
MKAASVNHNFLQAVTANHAHKHNSQNMRKPRVAAPMYMRHLKHNKTPLPPSFVCPLHTVLQVEQDVYSTVPASAATLACYQHAGVTIQSTTSLLAMANSQPAGADNNESTAFFHELVRWKQECCIPIILYMQILPTAAAASKPKIKTRLFQGGSGGDFGATAAYAA